MKLNGVPAIKSVENLIPVTEANIFTGIPKPGRTARTFSGETLSPALTFLLT
jgi:hypothetical protein